MNHTKQTQTPVNCVFFFRILFFHIFKIFVVVPQEISFHWSVLKFSKYICWTVLGGRVQMVYSLVWEDLSHFQDLCCRSTRDFISLVCIEILKIYLLNCSWWSCPNGLFTCLRRSFTISTMKTEKNRLLWWFITKQYAK